MSGLDPGIISSFIKDQAIGRVRTDLRTDFVFGPQYKLLVDFVPDDLWDEMVRTLQSGSYTPSQLITSEVPKVSGMTRPGSILYPIDRILYQAVADYMAPIVDPHIENAQVHSYKVLDPDPNHLMFEDRTESYKRYQQAITQTCHSGEFTHAVAADVSSYFVHLNHHTLENLLTASGISDSLVNLLVKVMLETWSGRFSYGIPQGMFPSDLLGNFYLTALDTHLVSRDIKYVRYVDDLVMFHASEPSAKTSLAPLCRFLRGIGLDLNESKSEVVEVARLAYEQTELDARFEAARDEIFQQLSEVEMSLPYGFQDPWEELEDEGAFLQEADSKALESLWNERDAIPPAKRDQLDRFCLGTFAGIGSDIAVGTVIEELGLRAHLTRPYCNYLATFVKNNPEIQRGLCRLLGSSICTYDWELQWPIAALLVLSELPQATVNHAVGILTDRRRSNELRAACALLIAKFGTGASRTLLRNYWEEENSEHVRSAMVLGTMFFGASERRVLLSHWGAQSPLYALIAKAVRAQLSGQP
jgi:hypothetical protein